MCHLRGIRDWRTAFRRIDRCINSSAAAWVFTSRSSTRTSAWKTSCRVRLLAKANSRSRVGRIGMPEEEQVRPRPRPSKKGTQPLLFGTADAGLSNAATRLHLVGLGIAFGKLKTCRQEREAEAVSARRTRPKEFDPWPRVFNLWNTRGGRGQLKNLPPRGAAHPAPNRIVAVTFFTSRCWQLDLAA
jgi:hypothetical protein